MRTTCSLVAALLVCVATARADAQASAGERACRSIEHFINVLVDYTTTGCLPASGTHGNTDFIIVAMQPVLHVPDAKRAWPVAVVGAAGKVLNDRPKMRVGRVIISDSKRMAAYEAFSLQAARVKMLQRQAYSGELSAEAFVNAVEREPVPFTVPTST